MPTATTFENIDWSTALPGADPYLVWASLSELRDFRKRGDEYQVAVETPDATNPMPITAGSPYGLRSVCASGVGTGHFFVGMVSEIGLIALAESTSMKLEFDVPRQAGGMTVGDGTGQLAEKPELGKSVIAVIDFGCPFAHQQFLTFNAGQLSSRVRYFWDQESANTVADVTNTDGLGTSGSWWYPVDNYRYGREITSPVMQHLFTHSTRAGVLDEDACYAALTNPHENAVLDARARHGSHVLDLAAGKYNPMANEAVPATDTASDADIIFVQLPHDTVSDTSGGSMTMYALDALTYIFEKTKDVAHLVINISYGSTAGPHDGTSMLERAMDCLIAQERKNRPGKNIEVVLPAGNHFLAQGHASMTLTKQSPEGVLNWQVMPDDATDTFVELWYQADKASPLEVALISPCGHSRISALLGGYAALRNAAGNAVGAIVHSDRTPNGQTAMALLALAPTHLNRTEHVEHGVWRIELTLNHPSDEGLIVNAWVERDDAQRGQSGQPQSYFLSTTSDRLIDSADVATDPVKRETTGSSLTNGEQTTVVAGYVRDSIVLTPTPHRFDLSNYSAAGPSFNTARTRPWPDYLAPSDESASLNGVLAAGTRSGVLVRMNGTSVAAPQVARQLMNGWHAAPAPRRAVVPAPVGDIRDARGMAAPVLP